MTDMDKKEKLVVCLSGGGPWGFRLQGGAGTGLPLVVSKVRRRSKAYKRLFEGDFILSVNDQSCQNLTYDQVMEIADKSGTDLTLDVLRQESNKENLVPTYSTAESTVRTSSPLKTMENGAVTKEIISMSETNTKITEEKEGIRIKSTTLLPDNVSFPTENAFENFTSQKLKEDVEKKPEEVISVDQFPPFSELLQTEQGPPKLPRSPADISTSSKTQEVSQDDNGFTKTTTETKHEVMGNTEMSFMKKEQESVSKSVIEGDGVSNASLDAMDLNDLISATQKRLDSFKNGFKTDIPAQESLSSMYEIRKTEKTTSTTISETKSAETISSLKSPFSNSILDSNIKDSEVHFKQDLDALNGGLGFTSEESSYIATESPFESSTMTKKKKMFSSSSFYEEPDSLYPTVEEQVEMARKIADSLADDTNRKSKGSNMFYKRVKKSSKWIHEGPEPSDESVPGTPEIQGVEPPTPDPSQVPFRPSKGPPKLKLLMDSRHPLDANALRSSGMVINEHNVISPEMCHGLVKDLHSPVGKGAALFAKRKKKSEDWVVDEERVKSMLREHEKRFTTLPQTPSYNQYSTFSRQDVKLVKTPWDAAMESPFGLCDAAFARVNPDQLADTVIKAADTKRRNSNTPRSSREPSRLEGCISPPAPITPVAAQYDIYHAKAPKGWTGFGTTTDQSVLFQSPTMPMPPRYVAEEASKCQNGFPSPKKMVFQNFNTVPRIWKGASAR